MSVQWFYPCKDLALFPVSTQRAEKAPRAAQVLLDLFCGRHEGIAADSQKCPDWLFRKIFPDEI